MIRNAVESDKTDVIRLLKDANENLGRVTGFVVPFDPAYACRLFDLHTTRNDCLCLVHDVNGTVRGVLMAHAVEHVFGPVRLARESMWWIDPAFRGRAAFSMVSKYDSWWRSIGCAYGHLVSMGDDPLIVRLYETFGYCAVETHYLKAA